MLNAVNWTARLDELATEANVPGAALGIWSDGQEILAAHGVLNSATLYRELFNEVFGDLTGVLRSRDDEPWVPLTFSELADGTPYIYLSGRVTPRVG